MIKVESTGSIEEKRGRGVDGKRSDSNRDKDDEGDEEMSGEKIDCENGKLSEIKRTDIGYNSGSDIEWTCQFRIGLSGPFSHFERVSCSC